MHLYDALLQHTSDAVVVTNLDALIQAVNPAFTTLTGYTAAEVIGKKPNFLKSGRYPAKFYQEMWQSIAGRGFWEGEIWNRKKNGEAYRCWLTILTTDNEAGKPAYLVGIASEVSPHQSDAMLAKYTASHYDALTGLPNFLLLKDKMVIAKAFAKRHNLRVAALYVELDGFKAVNDLLGYQIGDLLLREVAERLKNRVREVDTVVRLDGERFVVILTELKSLEDINQLAHTMLRWLEMPFSLQRKTVAISANMGIALYPDDHKDGEELLRYAQEAINCAKAAGKGHLCFYSKTLNQPKK